MQRGRGRGRGGGRGGPAPGGPVARDDDGTALALQQPEGPPQLYPEIELPEHPEISAKDSLLLLRRHDLVGHCKSSPFFLEPHQKQKAGAADSGVDRYSDRFNKRPVRVRQPLASVMTLVPEYFPEELFSIKDKTASQAQTKQAQDAFWKAQGLKAGAGGLDRLDLLAQKEKAAGEGGKPGELVGEEEDVPPDDLHIDDDEEEEMEYDDYYQGKHFDDDEGYDEYDEGGGGDDGPVY